MLPKTLTDLQVVFICGRDWNGSSLMQAAYFCTAQLATRGSPIGQIAKIADCISDYKWKACSRPKETSSKTK